MQSVDDTLGEPDGHGLRARFLGGFQTDLADVTIGGPEGYEAAQADDRRDVTRFGLSRDLGLRERLWVRVSMWVGVLRA